MASMIPGFVFQISASCSGPLAQVQPILGNAGQVEAASGKTHAAEKIHRSRTGTADAGPDRNGSEPGQASRVGAGCGQARDAERGDV